MLDILHLMIGAEVNRLLAGNCIHLAILFMFDVWLQILEVFFFLNFYNVLVFLSTLDLGDSLIIVSKRKTFALQIFQL